VDGGGQPGRGLSFLESGATEKEKAKKEASATAITHKLIKDSDRLLSNNDKEAVDVAEKSEMCVPKTKELYQI
jgi:hypothetical protein